MKTRTISTLVALGLSLGACGSGSRGLETVHQPVVTRADYSFNVNSGYGGLAEGDAERLAGWFDAMRLGFGDKVSVETNNGYDDGATKAAVASIAARYGLLLQDTPPSLSGSVPNGGARVIVSRLKAEVPSCPDWSGAASPNFTNKSSSNYGCAVNSNLAAMVADPEDLIRGKSGNASVDAASSNKAVKLYREAKPTGAGGLKSETTGGK